VASGGLRSELLSSFAAYKQLPEAYFSGPLAGSLYYGYLTRTKTYWALAYFSATPAASFQTTVDMQDGGSIGIFVRRAGAAWKVRTGGVPFPCPGVLPAAMMRLWGLTAPGSCQVASESSPARATLTSPSTALNLPAGTYFGTILYFDLNLDGTGTILFEPETWQGSSAPVSSDGNYVSLSFDPSTSTGFWVGTSPASSHEVTGHFDAGFAAVVEHAMEPFTSQPYSGYVIEATILPGCTGTCTEAASVTQFSSLTPTPVDPDYTEPTS
jgi:hypothetical protein